MDLGRPLNGRSRSIVEVVPDSLISTRDSLRPSRASSITEQEIDELADDESLRPKAEPLEARDAHAGSLAPKPAVNWAWMSLPHWGPAAKREFDLDEQELVSLTYMARRPCYRDKRRRRK